MALRTWEIADIDGSNKRTVTLTQYRAEIDASKAKARAAEAMRRARLVAAVERAIQLLDKGWEMEAYAKLQAALREAKS